MDEQDKKKLKEKILEGSAWQAERPFSEVLLRDRLL